MKNVKKTLILLLGLALSVILVLGLLGCQAIKIPNLVGTDEESAKTALLTKGLIPIVKYENSDFIQKGIVIRTEPTPGNEAEKDSQVTIVVSLGAPLLHEGDIISFGRYPQTRYGGLEPIEWYVIKASKDDNNRFLVLSKFLLEYLPYDDSHGNVTWETCSLRIFLNKIFLPNAFNATELKAIQQTTYNGITDRVFLLPLEIINSCVKSEQVWISTYTDYLLYDEFDRLDYPLWVTFSYEEGNIFSEVEEFEAYRNKQSGISWMSASWWVRRTKTDLTASNSCQMFEYPRCYPSLYYPYTTGSSDFLVESGVRPAMWIDISSLEFTLVGSVWDG